MSYDYREIRIVAVLSEKVEVGIALNVLGHLSLALGAHLGNGVLGRAKLMDLSGISHLGIAKYPVIVTKTKPKKLREAIQLSREIERVITVDYPEEMLHTGHDDELALAMGNAEEGSINYLGAIFYGPYEEVSKLTSRFSLWR